LSYAFFQNYLELLVIQIFKKKHANEQKSKKEQSLFASSFAQ